MDETVGLTEENDGVDGGEDMASRQKGGMAVRLAGISGKC